MGVALHKKPTKKIAIQLHNRNTTVKQVNVVLPNARSSLKFIFSYDTTKQMKGTKHTQKP